MVFNSTYKLIEEEKDRIVLILYLNETFEEFSEELGNDNHLSLPFKKRIQLYAKEKFPNTRIATVKVMVGTMLVMSISLNEKEAEAATEFNVGYLYFGTSQNFTQYIDRTSGVINVASPSFFDLNSNGTLLVSPKLTNQFVQDMKTRNVKVVPFLSNHWDRQVGRTALNNAENLSQQIADTIQKYDLDGIHVDIENVTHEDRENYTRLVKLLRQKVPAHKEVSVAVAANPQGWTQGWHGSYNYKELQKYADYLVIMAYDESYPGGEPGPIASIQFVEKSIQYAINQGVPREKIVLGLPHYGRYWMETTKGAGLSNNRIVNLLPKYNHSITYDQDKESPKATITIKPTDPVTYVNNSPLMPGVYEIWYENERSIKAKVNLVDKYNLKGTASWSIGQEDPSLWSVFRQWINPSVPVQGEITSTKDSQTLLKSGVTTTKVNLRTNPSTQSTIKTTLLSGSSFSIIETGIASENYIWDKVKLPSGEIGYIVNNYVKSYNVFSGVNRYHTSTIISSQGWREKATTIVLGRGDNPIDALTGSVLAKSLDAPLLLTQQKALPTEVLKEIDRLDPTNIILLGGTNAISEDVKKQLEGKGISTKRISGSTRYQTAIEVAKHIEPNNQIILTTGNEKSPDALAIAPHAAENQIPIVFTQSDNLDETVKNFIIKNSITKVTIIGGEAAVSDNIKKQLQNLGVTTIKRVSGPNRYSTSAAIAKEYYNPDKIYVASGSSFIDALPGSLLAARTNSPILFVSKDTIANEVIDYINGTAPSRFELNFLGGSAVISEDVRAKIRLLK